MAHEHLRRTLDDCAGDPFDFPTEIFFAGNTRAEVRWTGTCEVAGECKALRGLMLDMTEIRRLERELTAAQKLESVGRLAAGVAHEINTPVQFVADNVEFVTSSMASLAAVIRVCRELKVAVQTVTDAAEAARAAEAAESEEDIDYILENVPPALTGATEGLQRIATIVRSMKEFAHPDQASKSAVDLNHAIQSTLVIARNEYKYVAEGTTFFIRLPIGVADSCPQQAAA